VRDSDLLEELAVRRCQVDGDRAGRLVRDHAALERTARRLGKALIGADDVVIERAGGGSADLEDALERGDDIGGRKVATVGELDARPQLEVVGLAVIFRLRQAFGEVGDNLEAGLVAGLPERDQGVIEDVVQLEVLQRVVDVRITGARRSAREKPERAAPLALLRFGRGPRPGQEETACQGSGDRPFESPHLHRNLHHCACAATVGPAPTCLGVVGRGGTSIAIIREIIASRKPHHLRNALRRIASIGPLQAGPEQGGVLAARAIWSYCSSSHAEEVVLDISAVREDVAPFGEYQTWYRVTGDLQASKLPLLVAHGGPGCTHDYVDSFKELARNGRAVIHYDQVGNGRSTHLRDKGADFWTVDFFLAEMDNLLRHLGIQDRYALLGQSWGGMLGSEHAVRRPSGLKALVIANSPGLDGALGQGSAAAARGTAGPCPRGARPPRSGGNCQGPGISRRDQGVLRPSRLPGRAVAAGGGAHLCGRRRGPDRLPHHERPERIHVIGTLKTWSVIDRLANINVPTLVFRGGYDEATPECVQPFIDRIAGNESCVFENSSHMPHVEEKDACLARVEAFLSKYDSK
jgi:L-proline amide hydrolase